MFAGASRVAVIVAGAYLIVFFAFASGIVNALIEGSAVRSFIVPSRSVQTIGETVAITLMLFIGLAGAFLLHRAGRSFSAKSQKALLAGGFGVLAVAMLLGYLLISIKL